MLSMWQIIILAHYYKSCWRFSWSINRTRCKSNHIYMSSNSFFLFSYILHTQKSHISLFHVLQFINNVILIYIYIINFSFSKISSKYINNIHIHLYHEACLFITHPYCHIHVITLSINQIQIILSMDILNYIQWLSGMMQVMQDWIEEASRL